VTKKVRRNSTQLRTARYFQRYNALIAPLLPGVAAYTLWRRYGQKKSPQSFRGQWGSVPAEAINALHADSALRTPHSALIWLHAVSVGEQIAARAVLRALREAMPEARIALSVTTDTGMETARATQKLGLADAVFYFPLDAPWAIRRVLRAVRATVFLTMETELWPNILHLAKASGAQTFLVNGRVSDNLLKRAPLLGWIWRWMMLNLDGLLMRSEFDAKRIETLGAAREKIHVTGDVKLDADAPDAESQSATRERWREILKLGDALFWVAGSTHAGEESLVFQAYFSLQKEFPNLRLLIAPRHIERCGEVIEIARAQNLEIVRRTQIETAQASNPIILLDTVGELGEIYAAADVSFVGGSLIPRGGHNVLEPVLRGVPVAFGPHVQNFREAAALVQRAQIGKLVSDENELTQTLAAWLRDENERHEITIRARESLEVHRGAAMRVAEIIVQKLKSTPE